MADDTFELYDLELTVEAIHGNCTCPMQVGTTLFLRGGAISLPPDGVFCLYALQAAIPLLPAKQRRLQAADWMQTDTRITCPDPACGLIVRIDRVAQRILHHDDVSATPWEQVRERTEP